MSILARKQGEWKKLMSDVDTGPLKIAEEVVEVASLWAVKYSMHAGGKTCSTWLAEVFGAGRDERYWRRRHEAVQLLGGAANRQYVQTRWNHDAAVWAAGALKRCNAVSRAAQLVDKVETARQDDRYKPRVAHTALVQRVAASIDSNLRPLSTKHECQNCIALQKRIDNLEVQLGVRVAAE